MRRQLQRVRSKILTVDSPAAFLPRTRSEKIFLNDGRESSTGVWAMQEKKQKKFPCIIRL